MINKGRRWGAAKNFEFTSIDPKWQKKLYLGLLTIENIFTFVTEALFFNRTFKKVSGFSYGLGSLDSCLVCQTIQRYLEKVSFLWFT